jgi:hypothetical protein
LALADPGIATSLHEQTCSNGRTVSGTEADAHRHLLHADPESTTVQRSSDSALLGTGDGELILVARCRARTAFTYGGRQIAIPQSGIEEAAESF